MSHSSSINYRVADRSLKYYIFDWDDNILRMPTRIHLEHRADGGDWESCSVSTSLFAVVRSDTEHYRPANGHWPDAFAGFRDLEHEPESGFLRDTRAALDAIAGGHMAPPSFERFRKALVQGRLFGIVTARGHSAASIRRGVELFIERVLTDAEKADMLSNLRGYRACYDGEGHRLPDAEVMDYYLGLNRYHAVSSPEFTALIAGAPGAENPQTAKQLAIQDITRHLIGIISEKGIRKPVSIGFSDDDKGNVAAVEAYIHEQLREEFPGIRFVVYDTSDPELPRGRKRVIHQQESA